MKVLHLNEHFSIKGGVEIYLDQLQHHLPHAGWDTEWWGISQAENGYRLRHSGGDSSFPDLPAFLQHLEKTIEAQSIDILHLHSISDPRLVKGCLERIPVIRSMHEPRMFCPGHGKFWMKSEQICRQPAGLHCLVHAYSQQCAPRHPQRLWKSFLNTQFERTVGDRYGRIIVMSDFMKQESISAGYTAAQISVIPYFTPLVPMENLGGTYTGTKKILFIGRIIRHKGFHYLLEALEPLFEREAYQLDIIGDGINRPEMEQWIQASPAKDRIHCHGWQGRSVIHRFLRETDLLVFPSIYPEAFGIVGIEAMMHAKPVVAFKVGGVSSWLADGETGFLVENKNIPGLRDAIVNILENPSRYASMAAKARTNALEKFSPEKHIEKLIECYQEVLDR